MGVQKFRPDRRGFDNFYFNSDTVKAGACKKWFPYPVGTPTPIPFQRWKPQRWKESYLPRLIFCSRDGLCHGDSMLPSPVGGLDLTSADATKGVCYSGRFYSDINKLMGLDNRAIYAGSYTNHRSFGPVKCEREDLATSYHPYLQMSSASHTATHSWGDSALSPPFVPCC